jgi:cytochrome c peroxidase
VAYNGTFNWADATTASLEEQMRVPMFSLEPIELGLTGHEEKTLRALAAEPRYPPLFAAAFPGEQAPIHFDNVIRAIATFERSLVSADSPYDRFVRGGDRGRFESTARAEDMGRFRAPTLRNVALTAPYMHDGSVATQDDVLAHYSAGGRTVHEGPDRGVGRRNPYKSSRVRRLRLSPAAAADLRAFLESLTDQGFTRDPRYADPWRPRGTEPAGT